MYDNVHHFVHNFFFNLPPLGALRLDTCASNDFTPATPMTTIYEVCDRSRFLRTMKSNFSQVKYWIMFLKLIQLCHKLLLSIFADIFVYIHVCPYSTYKASFFCFFSVRLLSVLRGHSFFPSPPQWPMTSDFEGFSIPYFIHYIKLYYLNSWENNNRYLSVLN